MRFLIVNGYPAESRAGFDHTGVPHPHDLYERLLLRHLPKAGAEVFFVADEENSLPTDADLLAFDGVIWTGSDQTIYHDHLPRVARQIELARRLFALGVPQFGSCWGAQMAAVAAGGRVAKNPKGREWGFARRITLTPEGQRHPLTAGKPPVFQGIEMHLDEIVELPEGGVLLATGEHTRVQALAVAHEKGAFWATQYHPEFDLDANARLIAARAAALVKEGFFENEDAVKAYARDLAALHREPENEALREKLGVDETLLDPEIRELEFRNWLRHLVGASL